jgi:hypothetical protein
VPTTADMPAVRAIERDAAKQQYRFSSFVLGVVRSTPFQMKRVEEQVMAKNLEKTQQ